MATRRSIAFLGFVLLAAACAETPNEPLPDAELTISADATLPGGKGVQLYNPNLSCDVARTVCRGVFVSSPGFDPTPVSVKTGTWVTLGFDVLSPVDSPEVTDAYKASIVDFIVNDLQLGMFFDGQEIPVLESIRWDETTFTPDGPYTALTPVRYFVIPQRPGTYVYEWTGLAAGTRTVSWMPKAKM